MWAAIIIGNTMPLKSCETYQKVITVHFPEVPIHSITFFKEGWGNKLFLVNNEILFRFPQDAFGEQQLLVEIRLLPILAPELPLSVPDYQYVAPASDIYPYTFVGYPLIPGLSYPCAPETLRQAGWWRLALGEFLTALHHIPVNKVTSTGLQGYYTAQDWCDALSQKHEPYERHVFPFIPEEQRIAIRNYLRETIREERMRSFTPVIIHQDFDFHNILVDIEAQKVTGVVDFGASSIGDPAIDVSPDIIPYYHGKIDHGWDFRRDYYRRTSALEDLLYLVTCDHNLPDGETVRNRKICEVVKIWSHK
jgi:aminoglycoside 2''-phosphotransferase